MEWLLLLAALIFVFVFCINDGYHVESSSNQPLEWRLSYEYISGFKDMIFNRENIVNVELVYDQTNYAPLYFKCSSGSKFENHKKIEDGTVIKTGLLKDQLINGLRDLLKKNTLVKKGNPSCQKHCSKKSGNRTS